MINTKINTILLKMYAIHFILFNHAQHNTLQPENDQSNGGSTKLVIFVSSRKSWQPTDGCPFSYKNKYNKVRSVLRHISVHSYLSLICVDLICFKNVLLFVFFFKFLCFDRPILHFPSNQIIVSCCLLPTHLLIFSPLQV